MEGLAHQTTICMLCMCVKCLVLTVCQDHVARAVKDRRDREKLCRLNASAVHVATCEAGASQLQLASGQTFGKSFILFLAGIDPSAFMQLHVRTYVRLSTHRPATLPVVMATLLH